MLARGTDKRPSCAMDLTGAGISLEIPGPPVKAVKSSTIATARAGEKTSCRIGDWLSRFVVTGTESDPPPQGTASKRLRPCKLNPRPKELIFDSRFEGGNLGHVEKLSNYEYDLYIQTDSCNSRYRMWFNFCVHNVNKNQRVVFNIVNFSKSTSLFSKGMTPLVQSSSRPIWTRIPKKQVFYYRSQTLRRKYALTIAFVFDKEDDIYQFAYTYPYTYRDLQEFLTSMERMNYKYYKREIICTTLLKNNMDLVTITSPHNLTGATTAKTVLITARVHPGETPSSFVVEGLMEFLLGRSVEAQMLRENIIFKIVPMINPDGVVVGNYRCAINGEDLNRHWTDSSFRGDLSVRALKSTICEIKKDSDLNFCIDVHAHSSQLNSFMYGNIYRRDEQMLEEAIFPKILAAKTNDFSWNQTLFNYDVVKSGSSRRFPFDLRLAVIAGTWAGVWGRGLTVTQWKFPSMATGKDRARAAIQPGNLQAETAKLPRTLQKVVSSRMHV